MIPPAAQAGERGAAAAISEEQRRESNRKTSNRLSARKSRMRKQQYVGDLEAVAARLQLENEAMRAGIGVALEQSRLLEQQNRLLAAHARELCGALQLRNSQLRLLADVAGVPLDMQGVADHLMELYGGLLMPPSLPWSLQVQMMFQPDAMD